MLSVYLKETVGRLVSTEPNSQLFLSVSEVLGKQGENSSSERASLFWFSSEKHQSESESGAVELVSDPSLSTIPGFNVAALRSFPCPLIGIQVNLDEMNVVAGGSLKRHLSKWIIYTRSKSGKKSEILNSEYYLGTLEEMGAKMLEAS